MKAAVLVLSLATIFGLGGMHLVQDILAPNAQRYTFTLDENASSIEKARAATFGIRLPAYGVGGSAVLVGRKKLSVDSYRYAALTAYHVIEKMAKAFSKDKLLADHSINIMLQPTFHGRAIRLNIDINDIKWTIPAHDWAVFTFNLEYKLPCVEMATEAEFKSLVFLDTIYAVGSGAGYGQLIREGNIGATHNEHIALKEQIATGRLASSRHPEKFFRPYISGWRGDSGGGIFNKDGKLIGIMTATNVAGVEHLTVALKTYFILDIVKNNKDLFVIED